MKYNILHITLFFPFLFLSSVSPLKVSADTLTVDESFAREIIERYGSSVFAVNAYTKFQKDDNTKKEKNDKSHRWCQNVGTAFLLDNSGHLITFNCVIKDAEEIRVISSSGEKITADVLGHEDRGKINVLKIDHIHVVSIPEVALCGDMSFGEKVILLGVKERVLTAVSGSISNIRPSDGTVVVTVSGDPGTTGTPVFDKNKHLLGFLAYKIEKDNNGKDRTSKDDTVSETEFYVVIPAESARVIARSIINRAEGKCGWLGISSSINNIDNSGKNGIVIQRVMEDSPAEKCGLKINDYLFEFNSISILSPVHLIEAITATRAGDTVSIKVRRGNKILSSKVTLSVQPETE